MADHRMLVILQITIFYQPSILNHLKTNRMKTKRTKKETHIPSRTSPKGGRRGCLCKDGKRYSISCCDGSIGAQGIGKTQA